MRSRQVALRSTTRCCGGEGWSRASYEVPRSTIPNHLLRTCTRTVATLSLRWSMENRSDIRAACSQLCMISKGALCPSPHQREDGYGDSCATTCAAVLLRTDVSKSVLLLAIRCCRSASLQTPLAWSDRKPIEEDDSNSHPSHTLATFFRCLCGLPGTPQSMGTQRTEHTKRSAS